MDTTKSKKKEIKVGFVKLKPSKPTKAKVVVFSLRHDSITGLNEGEAIADHELPGREGIIYPYISASPKVYNEEVYICIGKKAIKEGWTRLEMWIGQNDALSKPVEHRL